MIERINCCRDRSRLHSFSQEHRSAAANHNALHVLSSLVSHTFVPPVLRFVNPKAEGFLFRHHDDCNKFKDVPPGGFGAYTRQLWEAIRANKDLNLPSEKEVLATFRSACAHHVH